MYNSIKDGVEFKVLNLDLERSEPFKDILDATLKEKFGEYFKELTP